MIDDSAVHRVLKIGELTRAITNHLTSTGRKSATNLACTCRCLEEPVLSTLWEEQPWLEILLEVLPEENRDRINPGFGEWVIWVVRGPGRPLQMLNAQIRFASVQDHGESLARGLEESPPLRVLDAPNQRGLPGSPWRGDHPPIPPQSTC